MFIFFSPSFLYILIEGLANEVNKPRWTVVSGLVSEQEALMRISAVKGVGWCGRSQHSAPCPGDSYMTTLSGLRVSKY